MTSSASQNAAVIAALSTPAAVKALAAFAAANTAAPAPAPSPTPTPTPAPAPAPSGAPSQFAWAQLAPVALNDWTAKTEVVVGGSSYFSENAGKSYDLGLATNSTADLTRFEVRPGEYWTSAMGGNDTERSELDGSAATTYGHNVSFWIASDITFEAGAPQITTAGGNPGGGAAWCVPMQVHGNGSQQPVPWQLNFLNETFSVSIQTDPGQTWKTLWTDSAPTPRGTTRRVVANLSIGGTSSDFCNVWIDGVQVVAYTGAIGSAKPDPAVYFKFGLYRGWQGDGLPPLAVWHANVKQGTASLLSRVTNPPPLPVSH